MTDRAALPARFVLVDVSHPGNVGAAARAIKVMGFDDLVLVRPRWPDVLVRDEAIAMASGATDVLARARIVGELGDALDGVDMVCATAMTPRDFGPPTHAPRPFFEALAARPVPPARIGFVFGGERFGLGNEEVWRCHACLSIPTAPDYGSLNLAQAVQLIAYEWRQAQGGYAVLPRTATAPVADAAALDGVIAHWRAALEAVGYLDAQTPRRLMARLRQLLNRAEPRSDEIHILRGIARAMLAKARRPDA